MANVINKTTLEYKTSVNTPDYLDGAWIVNPDLSLVQGVDKRYWKVVDDTVLEMDQSEKDVVDSAGLPDLVTLKIKNLWQSCFDYQSKFYTEPIFTRMSEMKALGDSRVIEVEDWVNGLWNEYYTRRYIANHVTNKETLDNISLDFSVVGNPPYTVADLLGVEL